MSIDLDIPCIDQPVGALEFRPNTVRVIGDILPLVIAKYGLDRIDDDCEVPGQSEQIPLR
ncbi:MAG TPA: hypothetical protein VGZ26_06090 [Pirellulales bacterium]|jgi:hypothetical protein|nr:hypothetical protein [Pirellulales bacterium]